MKSHIVDKLMQNMTKLFEGAEAFIDDNLQDSREKSLAFTKLEECLMWCRQSIRVYGAKK